MSSSSVWICASCSLQNAYAVRACESCGALPPITASTPVAEIVRLMREGAAVLHAARNGCAALAAISGGAGNGGGHKSRPLPHLLLLQQRHLLLDSIVHEGGAAALVNSIDVHGRRSAAVSDCACIAMLALATDGSDGGGGGGGGGRAPPRHQEK